MSPKFYRIAKWVWGVASVIAVALSVLYFILSCAGIYNGWVVAFIWLFNAALFAFASWQANKYEAEAKNAEAIRVHLDEMLERLSASISNRATDKETHA